jgi:cobalt-zinc-cadmium efflux system outer membrane protein
MSYLSSRPWGVCLFLLLAPAVFAADIAPGNNLEPTGELSLAQAIAAALKRNPELAVTSFELTAAEARIAQAGLRRNPEAAVQFENLLGTGEASGVKILETTLSLSQVIEFGGKRSFRVGVAGIGRDLAAIERQAQQLDVLAEVTRRFIAVVAAQQGTALAQQATALTEQTLTAIAARVAAARSPVAEQSRAGIAVTRARIEQQQAASTLQSTRRAVAALWGGRTAAFTNANAELFTLPDVQSFETLSARLQSNPDFLRFVTEARLRDAELRLAQAYAKPNLNIDVGVRRFEATGNAALVAGFSYALPVFDRNQGAIREAQIRREQSTARSQAALIRAEATLYSLYQELLAARTRVQTLHDDAIPHARAALEQTRNGYERGRFSYLELASAQQELLGLESAAIQAAVNFHLQLVEIERLTAEPMIN